MSETRWPAMESGRFQIRRAGDGGMDVRLPEHPEAFRHWTWLDIHANDKDSMMDEVEEWCAEVLAHIDRR